MRDHVERLGLPRRFSIDAAEVERLYLAKSRDVHPDFHQLGTDAERRNSLEQTAALNEAYLTLRDWFRRAEYLLNLLGGPTAREEKNLDQAFLTEMMDLRERIEDIRSTKSDPDGLETELNARLATLEQDVAKQFAMIEIIPPTANPRDVLVSIRKQLNAAKTLGSLLRDLRSD